MLWIWVLVALTATVLTNMENSWNQVFETQSVRTTSSLWLQDQNSWKDYCKVTFNPKSPTINEPFTVTVDWIVTNGMTIETFIQWPNSGWWWMNNFSWLPIIITENKEISWKYVYTFTIKWDSVTKCEWTITIWKRIKRDPIWPGPIIETNPNTKTIEDNTVWAIDVDANNTAQPRSLRE